MGRKFQCFNKKSTNDSFESQRSVHLILRNDDKAAGGGKGKGGKGERGKGGKGERGKGGGMGKSDAKWPHTHMQSIVFLIYLLRFYPSIIYLNHGPVT